ncbi:MAG: cyclopropane fatty acyl phospholipid synthase [Patescibacteria group bacterium]
MAFKNQIQKLLDKAGITINGSNPWDIQVHDERFYGRVIRQGLLGLGESYMDGWWDVPELDQFFYKAIRAQLEGEVQPWWQRMLERSIQRFFNLQSRARAFQVGEQHYDIGNDLYTRMLDSRMVYSCGYWKDAKTLDEAQEAKLDLICRKIGLKDGQRVLDIGCGWGSFAKFAAEMYGAHVVGLTISVEQAKLAQEVCAGLPVEIRVQDYRDLNERFDHIISIGMFEHVGYKNYREYMEMAHRCLAPDGFFLLHTIGGNESGTGADPWTQKYIFPNGMLPSVSQIGRSIEGLFVMEDWHNFGAYYDTTLMAWNENFQAAWPDLEKKYGERFKRMWQYYLLIFAGSFRARADQLWQVVLSPKGVPGGYTSVR